MSKRTVCRACLVDNLTMYRVTNSPYEEVYEKLSNDKIGKGNLPETFCYICMSMLRKFQKFATLTRDSNAMLEQWYKNEIDCKPKKRPQFTISTTTVEYIASTVPDSEQNKDIKIKVEPDETDALHQVQFIEFTNETDPYIQPEDDNDSHMKDRDSDADQKPDVTSDEEFEVPVVKQEPRKRPAQSEKTPKGTPANKKTNTEASRTHPKTRKPKGGIPKRKIYSCDYCNHKSYFAALKIHLQKNHSDKKLITCDFCDHETLNKSLLESHISKYHKGDQEYVCYICEYTSISKQEFMEHQKIHTGTKAYSCHFCGLKFTGKISLRSHLDSVHKSELKDTNMAAVINKEVNDIIEKIIPNEFPYSCDKCEYKCGFKFEFEYHRFIHEDKWPFVCNNCDYRSLLKERVKDHLMTHYDEKQYVCKLCGLKSLYKNNLELHVRGTHFGEKPFSCDECDYKCLEKGNLKRHYLSQHSSREKRFLCHMCDRRFAIREGLANHLKVHAGDKKYTCPTCGYKAQRKGTLVTHLRTHTGEKPYICTVCDRRFAQKSALNTHVKLKRHVNRVPNERK